MPYVFVTVGARSGKSALAERLAVAGDVPVTLLATAEALDAEMAARIAAHRSVRDEAWETVEEATDLVGAVRQVDPDRFVIVDCLTIWVSNVLADMADDEVVAVAGALAGLLERRPGGAVVVSNEVGDGIVPADPLTRRYRDLLGRVNAVVARRASDAYLTVAGRVVQLGAAPW